MPPTSQHLAAERAFRELLDENDLPRPDTVEYEEASVVFLWHETKLAVVIDLADAPPTAAPYAVPPTAALGGAPPTAAADAVPSTAALDYAPTTVALGDAPPQR